MTRRIDDGSPKVLGVTLDAAGVNVAVFSAHATAVEFCLFDAIGAKEVERIRLPARTDNIFHGHIAEIGIGARYGLRAHGPYAPREGHRFNPAKLLIDPYARVIDRPFKLHPSMLGFRDNNPYEDWARDDSDSAPYMPKAIVATASDRAPSRRPVSWPDTIIYELHVRGFTKARTDLPETVRGTFAGLARPAVLDHLKRLGTTSVELMPAAGWIDERHLPGLGLSNYWGYNPVPMLAPDPRLAPGGWNEIADTIEALHRAGLEVILDVVLNHSGESDEYGVTVCYRGLDNASYYRLLPEDRARYINDMGCGNCLALDRPPMVRLALDALRTWAHCGIDGLRFDLATALGRRDNGFDPAAPLLQAIGDDPLLKSLKLIAEPWDIGPGGYQVGHFPDRWAQWNDRGRDDLRRFWRGDGARGDLATRLAGSSDLLPAQNSPSHNINFVTAHDGFTLADLVSYEHKHNEANGEQNRDGTGDNHSWNNGAEGPSDDPGIVARRQRDQINLLATLLVARGTPMLFMGSELGHSQHGNNNAYAQDNAASWIDWSRADGKLEAATAALIALRKAHPALHADRWLTGKPIDGAGVPDVEWRGPEGALVTGEDWHADNGNILIMVLAQPIAIVGLDRIAVTLHRGHQTARVALPEPRDHHAWRNAFDTDLIDTPLTPDEFDRIDVPPRTVLILVEEKVEAEQWKPRPPDSATLDRLARAAGIAPEWWDEQGHQHIVSDETKHALLAAMSLPHASGNQVRESLERLAHDAPQHGPAADTRCFLPDSLRQGARRFGLSAQLYALRRVGDQGIGDFSTLARLGERAGGAGCGIVGVNPFHALFLGDRERASPYHPSDRRFLDPIYIDLAALEDLPGHDATRYEGGSGGRFDSDIIDYPAVWALKYRTLEAHFTAFEEASLNHPSDPLVAAFASFVIEGSDELRHFATHEAIAETRAGETWLHWPAEWHDPTGLAIAEFAAGHQARVRFHMFLQWLADRQFAAAAGRARAAGLEFGFYRDLAVGAAPDGAESWSNAEELARGISIGAPPDRFSADGQIWNLPPPDPHAARRRGFRAFRTLIAANMRHAGALRIDHAMGLTRLFWVPNGAKGAEGTYVAYPLEEQLAHLAEASRRQRCMVIGEDLGTVPEGFRERLAAADILSYRVLWFEREGTGFKPPPDYPAKAVACVSTHDLPTLAGWWIGADYVERERLGQITAEAAADARIRRRAEKEALARALVDAGLLAAPPDFDQPMAEDFAAAAIGWVGGAPAYLVLAQADDLAHETIATNLPGTDRERPNWRRRLKPDLEELLDGSLTRRVIERLRATRSKP